MNKLFNSFAIRIACLVGLFLFVQEVKATHIVGGYLSYNALGNDEYEIVLTIYRDCDTGIPWFDDPAEVHIHRGLTAGFAGRADIPLTLMNDTLAITTPDSCLEVNTTACIHKTVYRAVVLLPYDAWGYTLQYEVCCRNQDIVNIVDPVNTTASYWTYIPARALLGENSAPTFNEDPAVYLCANKPLHLDYSATDVDGDSLVYELCTPSASINNSGFPPINSTGDVIWRSPYTQNNMLGGNDPLRIDPQTGILTGTPPTLGIFLVGVCIKEYRDGLLISINKRGFQHLVGVCSELNVADFEATRPFCSKDLSYQFEEQAQVATGSSIWLFDGLGSSTLDNPSFTFPDTGQYQVQLIVGVGSLCPDTMTQTIDLVINGVNLQPIHDSLYCEADTAVVKVLNQWEDYTDSTTYQWLANPTILGSTTEDSLQVLSSQTQNYQVIGTNAQGCKDTTQATAYLISAPPPLTITASADSIFLGQEVNLLATNASNYSYAWAAHFSLSNLSIYNPIAQPDSSTYYYLEVKNEFGCTTLDSIQIVIRQPICGLPVVFIPNAFSPDGDGYNDELLVNGNNITTMTLQVYNRWGQQVFVSNDQSIGWDGSYKGTDLPPDVYGYYLQCICADGSTLRTKGNITLLR